MTIPSLADITDMAQLWGAQMKKLRDVTVRETVVEGRVVYLCVSGDKIELFNRRESAEKRARERCIVVG